MGQQIYSTGSGNWLCPAGVTSVTAKVWGGGGSGASTANPGGGGGGGYSSKVFEVTPGTNYAYAVGAGGLADGNAGGQSSFNATIYGNGGAAGVDGAGGAGGAASGGTTNLSGEAGGLPAGGAPGLINGVVGYGSAGDLSGSENGNAGSVQLDWDEPGGVRFSNMTGGMQQMSGGMNG